MCCCCVSLFLCCSCLASILFLSLPHSLRFSLCFSLFSVFCMTSHSESRTYSNEICCCTAVHHAKYMAPSIIVYSSIIQSSRSGVTDGGLLHHTSTRFLAFICDSSCSNAFPHVLCRCHCRYHRCKDVRRVATVHIPSMPVRLYHCQYVGRVTCFC